MAMLLLRIIYHWNDTAANRLTNKRRKEREKIINNSVYKIKLTIRSYQIILYL